jgi:hypothetical protein
MRFWLGVAALLAGVSGPIVSKADSIARIGGPKETPPASFTGPQFVDSRGCIFMRAGYGGVVKWVPRINDSHQVLCGYQPTMAGTMVATAATPAPAPMQPMKVTSPAPVAMAPVQPMMAPPPQPMMVAAAPQPMLAPVYVPAPAPVAAAVNLTVVSVPPGYVLAWPDGRLNPMRGRGSAEGQVAMARIWTRTVPMKLQPTQGVSVRPSSIVDTAYQAPVVRMAASNTPAPAVTGTGFAGGGRYVQVGSFAVAANAEGAANRLRVLGLPVATGGGGGVQVVMAGPFADPAALSAALQAAHAAGFGDAFVRN